MSIRVKVRAAIVHTGKILLIEYDDETGLHYNLPGGGVEIGESLHDALKREVQEETTAEIAIGRLLLAWEYVPPNHGHVYGNQQSLSLLFQCSLIDGSEPQMPMKPDTDQTGVRWISLEALDQTPLLPPFKSRLAASLRGEIDNPFCGEL